MHINLENRSAILLMAFAVACVSAWLTINGMISLYQEVMSTIIVTMLTLEASKITIAGWLIIGRNTYLKYPLAAIMVALMILSLWGHFGYFTDAYTQRSVEQVSAEKQSSSIEVQIERYEQELDQIQSMLQEMPDNYITRREALYEKTAPRRLKLNSILDSLYLVRSTSVEKELQTEIEVGPFRHIAILFGMSQEAIARLISMWLAAIIDPLALMLIMAGVKKTEKEKEVKKKKKKKKKDKVKTLNPEPTEAKSSVDISVATEPMSKKTNPERPRPSALTHKDYPDKSLGDTKTLIIGGNPLDGVFKLAPALQSERVAIHLSPANHYLEPLCRLIPSIEKVILEESITDLDGTFLVNRPSTDGHANLWAPQQYSQRAGLDPISRESWLGAVHTEKSSPADLLKGAYINLSDRNAEQSLKRAMLENSKNPNDKMIFFHHLDTIYPDTPRFKPDFQLTQAAITGTAYQKRLISIGPVSAAFELLGIPFVACQGQLSEKVVSMYRANNSPPLLDIEDMLTQL